MAKNNSVNDRFQSVKIEYSVNGETWTEVGTYTKISNYITLDTPVTARYVKASEATEHEATNWIIVREFGVNVEYVTTLGDAFNVYDGARDGALSYIDHAYDGDENTYLDLATVDGGTQRTVTINLGAETTFDTITMLTGGLTWADLVSSCEIAYSTDGAEFISLGSYAEETGSYSIALETAVTAKYIRITVGGTGWATIREIAVSTAAAE